MKFKHLDLVSVKTVPLREISVRQAFFDSLREDYSGFDQWYGRVAKEGRMAWVIDKESEVLDTLCIFKEEANGESITDDGRTLPGRFLKMCTLKVTANGYRYGQRLLYASFQYALRNGLGYVYAQVREANHERMVRLLRQFGFKRYGAYHADTTYVKDLSPGDVPLISLDREQNFKYCKFHYPYHLDGGAIRKFLISLEPDVHEQYFVDARIRRLPLELLRQGMSGEANAIRKAVVQSDALTAMRTADLLFFYRQATDGEVRGFVDHLGIVESVMRYDMFEEIDEADRDCIPYSDETIREMIKRSRGIVFVFFWVIQRITPGISRSELIEHGFDTHHRRVRRIPERLYCQWLKTRLLPYGVQHQSALIGGHSRAEKGFLKRLTSVLLFAGRFIMKLLKTDKRNGVKPD